MAKVEVRETNSELTEPTIPMSGSSELLKLELLSNENIGFTRQIVIRSEEGESIVLADLYANITNSDLSQTTNYSVNVVNKKLVMEHQEAVQEQIDKFLADIRLKANSIGMLSL